MYIYVLLVDIHESPLFRKCESDFINKTIKCSNALLISEWLSGRVFDSRPKGRGFEPHRRHCVVSLSKNINPSLVLVQPRKTRPFITERLLMGRKESIKQTNKLISDIIRPRICTCNSEKQNQLVLKTSQSSYIYIHGI